MVQKKAAGEENPDRGGLCRNRTIKQTQLIAQCGFIFLFSFCFMRFFRFSDSG
jgi:hypothetical protein